MKPISLAHATRSVAAMTISSHALFASNELNGRLRSPVALASRIRSSTRVLAVAQFQAGELAGHDLGGGVGDQPGDPVPAAVGEPQLRTRMGAFLAQDQPGPFRPCRQVRPVRWLRRPTRRRGSRRRRRSLALAGVLPACSTDSAGMAAYVEHGHLDIGAGTERGQRVAFLGLPFGTGT